ncbi:hypothetical protein TanjilG_21626 [Lupinus angustifolius]|uniref:Uncharacterized protein n=1 Tax=Lupinus angustifolius TaxID=3871 RepID=A0A4P1QUK5_LUPAN|nr:PREDICTED: probable serine/threonine-protein kinase DDB_G0280133 [Lupinus angustifolius]OIV95236.1 hypothetical protein TanjilG_21626 [Lupinus angustifolius]
MRNTIRCCISCILPCGSLDVIRIVHSNGRVEEISGTIKAIDIMKAYPKHVLKKPSSSSTLDGGGGGGVVPKIVVVPPEAELQRGKIYFLMPLPSPPSDKNHRQRKKKKEHSKSNSHNNNNNNNCDNTIFVANLVASSDRYLSDILSEKKLSTQRDGRRGRVAVWRPRLESISESPSDL